ncbi:MAG: hypothetical protein ACI4AM_07360, partial [Muribaculaceae bacterium]
PMKKLYALLSLAAVAVSATAATPLNAELPQLPRHSFQTAELQNVAQPQVESTRMRKAPAKAAAATSVADFQGIYLGESYSLRANESQTANVGWQVDGIAGIFDVGDGTVTISGLWDESIELTGGVFDPESQTISFSPQDPGVSGGNYNVYLAVLDLATNTLSDEDIVFNVDFENRNIWYMGDIDQVNNKWATCLCIAAMNPTTGAYAGGFDWLPFVDFNEVNGYVQYSYYEENATEPTDTYDFIYTEIQGNDLVCYNLLGGGFSYPVPFTVDATARTATCVDAVFTEQSDGTAMYPFYLCDVVISGESASLGSTTVETDIVFGDDGEGGTLTGLTKDYVAAVCDYNGQLLPWVGNGLIYDFTIVYTGDLLADMAGVEDIRIDTDNTNAPVEYFNLQGQRVANPAAGQVYIRRQGSEATKVRF